jgi:2-oxo-4-hydroxy-4-carboxy-5-ureidoimidazoline decarboxylase
MAALTLDALNAMDQRSFVQALGDTVEHAPWVAEAAAARRPFADMAALLRAMTEAVSSSGDDRKMTLIKGHPDLAGKAARAGTLTADSTAEQASARLNRLSEREYTSFHRLNDAYRAKFGMPFIVCVRRHGKESILRQFEQRLQNDAASERETALVEIMRIVALRLDQRIDAPVRLAVNGRLSTHVLDLNGGKPAAGIAIELYEMSHSDDAIHIASAVTNSDGRTDRPLIADRPIPIAQYELRFAVGDHYARIGTPVADPPFLGVVPIRFSVAEPEGHYHVPLLVTPWSYSTYRGS